MSKILIVDDSPAQLYSLRKMVEAGGHQAVIADSGEAAIELAADEHPEVILMDIVMPGHEWLPGHAQTRQRRINPAYPRDSCFHHGRRS